MGFSEAYSFVDRPVPVQQGSLVSAGIGLKSSHFFDIIETRPELGFLEIHAENYLVDGGPFHHYLTQLRSLYSLSIHGVGLSIGAEVRPSAEHLKRLAALVNRYEPQSFSEHLAWSTHSDMFLNDLLPLSYDASTLDRVCEHLDIAQNALGQPILIENPATYLEFSSSVMDEADFISAVVARSGCGLLLDINNVYVTCINHRRNPYDYIRSLPLARVGEIHLAGFTTAQDSDGSPLLIDSHDRAIAEEVWALYCDALSLIGPTATLIERDGNVPPLDDLLIEATVATRHMQALAPHGFPNFTDASRAARP